MSNDITPPIRVTDSTTEGQIATAARYIVTTLGGYALGRGWIDNELLQVLVAVVTVAAPMLYGVYKTYTQKAQLIATAEAAPNSVAVVVSN